MPAKHRVKDRQPQTLGHLLSHAGRMVEAALTKLVGVGRHRDHRLHRRQAEEPEKHQPSEGASEVNLPIILQAMDRLEKRPSIGPPGKDRLEDRLEPPAVSADQVVSKALLRRPIPALSRRSRAAGTRSLLEAKQRCRAVRT